MYRILGKYAWYVLCLVKEDKKLEEDSKMIKSRRAKMVDILQLIMIICVAVLVLLIDKLKKEIDGREP